MIAGDCTIFTEEQKWHIVVAMVMLNISWAEASSLTFVLDVSESTHHEKNGMALNVTQ